MAHAVRRNRLQSANFDRLLTLATVAFAGCALLLALLQLWEAGAVVGLIAVLLGGWAQLISETRTERFENIIAITLAGVVVAVCLASGGGLVS